MATDRVRIDRMAHVIMEGLQEYADLAADELKAAVKKAGNEAKKDIQANAPVKTGEYKKSWAVKTTKETSNAMEVVVHSRNRYSAGSSSGVWSCKEGWRKDEGISAYCTG